MPKRLDPNQQEFLKKYIADKSPREVKEITAAYLDFERRQEKLKKLLNNLPKNPEVDLLWQQSFAASRKSRAGDFAAAYNDLDEVKKQARRLTAGNKTYAGGLSLNELRSTMQRVSRELDEVVMASETVRLKMDALIKIIQATPRASTFPDMETAFDFRRDLSGDEAMWRGDVERYRGYTDTAGAKADSLSLQTTLTLLAFRLQAIQKDGDSATRKQAETLTQPLLDLNKKATFKGSFFTRTVLRVSFLEQVDVFEKALAVVTDVSQYQVRDAEEGPKTESMARLAGKEEKRVAAAKQRYMAELQGDMILGHTGPTRKKQTRTALRTFDIDDVIAPDLGTMSDRDLTKATIDAAVTTTIGNLTQFIGNEPPGSDRLFDLLLKNQADFKIDLARNLGLSEDGSDWSRQQKTLIDTLAAEIYKTMLANSPNRAADDMSTISVNGKNYGNKEKVSAGGLGDIFRYTSDDGQKVIVKNLRVTENAGQEEADRKRAEMVHEMKMHRQISGGESGECHENVLPMRGAAIGKDGMLLMLMDEAEGGDLNSLSESMNELAQDGLIPDGARAALIQRTMQQAVRGLKEMHSQDMMHLDVKAYNYFLDANGKVMIADFGSARSAEEDGKVESGMSPTTPIYAPPQFGEKISPEEEVYWLGSMIEGMNNKLQGSGMGAKLGVFRGGMVKARTGAEGTDADGEATFKPNKQTAFDRLRNAMLDPDPAKRPSLDAVLLSSYLTDTDRSNEQENIDDLMKAMTAYNTKVGREVQKITKEMGGLRGDNAKLEQTKPDTLLAQDDKRLKIKENEGKLADFKKQLDAINARPDVAKLIADIQKAGAAFQ